MANDKQNKKLAQLSLEEYNKVKEKRAHSKLKLQFPLLIKLALIIPLVYFVFLFIYYIVHLRFLAEH